VCHYLINNYCHFCVYYKIKLILILYTLVTQNVLNSATFWKNVLYFVDCDLLIVMNSYCVAAWRTKNKCFPSFVRWETRRRSGDCGGTVGVQNINHSLPLTPSPRLRPLARGRKQRTGNVPNSEPSGPGFNSRSRHQVFHVTASWACCTWAVCGVGIGGFRRFPSLQGPPTQRAPTTTLSRNIANK
jgi:hypothetical protein